jgi:hypothetical protein
VSCNQPRLRDSSNQILTGSTKYPEHLGFVKRGGPPEFSIFTLEELLFLSLKVPSDGVMANKDLLLDTLSPLEDKEAEAEGTSRSGEEAGEDPTDGIGTFDDD